MRTKYSELIHLRITKEQYDHCTKDGSYTDFIRKLIDQDMQGITLEDKIRSILSNMGISAHNIAPSALEAIKPIPPKQDKLNDELNKNVKSSINQLFNLEL